MSLKKILFDLTVIALAFLLFVFWYQKTIHQNVQTSTTQNNRDLDVYLITTDRGYQYWGILNQGAADMAALMGVNYVWQSPDDRSTEKQIELINNAVEQGAEALIVAADDPGMLTAAIEAAKEKGVKIIYVDSPPYNEAIVTLSTDNYKAGVKAAQTMLTIFDDTGKVNGSIGIINLAEKANTRFREEGFRDTIEKDNRFKLLETAYVEQDNPEASQREAERLMRENEDLVGLFGTSEGTSIGVGNAIKESGNLYTGVGFDKTDAMLRLLRDKNLNAIIAQNPYTMGYLGMAQAVAAVNGEDTGPEYIDTGVSVLVNY